MLLLFAVCCLLLLFAVYCLLFAVCCLLFAVAVCCCCCCLLFAVCCLLLLFAVCCLLFAVAVCCLLFAVCCLCCCNVMVCMPWLVSIIMVYLSCNRVQVYVYKSCMYVVSSHADLYSAESSRLSFKVWKSATQPLLRSLTSSLPTPSSW